MLLPAALHAQETPDRKLVNISLVESFYKSRSGKAFWFSDDREALPLRRQLLTELDLCEEKGLSKRNYAYETLTAHLSEKNIVPDKIMVYDRLYTDAAISYFKDILSGDGIEKMIGYDELSPRSALKDNKLVLGLLAGSTNDSLLHEAISKLDPVTMEYRQLSGALLQALSNAQYDSSSQLKTALNYYRWIHHFQFKKCIVINIASGTLRYLERDSILLEMKIVAGTPHTTTPRFAASCDKVILYPYWNVPHSIAVNEILPAVKKAAAVLAFLNMQVIDKKGNILDAGKIKWKAYNKKNFPYRFRQSTGCDNALGIIKFNLTSPYGVYLHDTNSKFSFTAKKRYFSHGCIRLEKPVDLGNYLLNNQLDSNFLSACLKNQQPVVLALDQPVPVFVIYVTAGVEAKDVCFYDDIYGLQ